MQVGPKIILGARAHHRRDDFAADHKNPNVAIARFFDKFLHQDIHICAAKRLDHRFCRPRGIAQNNANALRSFEQFNHHRRAADYFQHFVGLPGVMGKGGNGQAQTMLGKNLHRSQLVAAAADGHAFVERPNAHHFKLPQHGQAILGDRRADPRDDRIISAKRFAII